MRQAVAHLQEVFEVSQRRACAVLGADRTMVRCVSRRPDDVEARERIRELAVSGVGSDIDGPTGCYAGKAGQ